MARIQQHLDEIPGAMAQHFQSITPIDTGNARRSTSLRGGKDITGDYAYANRLNQGYSRQAPDGMRDPTIEYARQQLRKLN